jgi:putative glycosyltransferase (TIGR04372 family)
LKTLRAIKRLIVGGLGRLASLRPERADPEKRFADLMKAGAAHEQQREWRRAVRTYKRAARLRPRHSAPHLAIGNSEASARRHYRAIEAFNAALTLDPSSPQAHFRLGELLTHLGLYEDAVEHFARAVDSKPEWLEAREVFGRALWTVHDHAGAQKVWREWKRLQDEQAREHGLDPDDFRVLNHVWTGWLGNNAHFDPYIKLRELGWAPKRKLKMLAAKDKVANKAYLSLWSRYAEVVTDDAEIEKLSSISAFIGDSLYAMWVNEKPAYFPHAIALAQGEWNKQHRAALIGPSEADNRRGRQELARMGMPADAWFACLHVREGGFWNEAGNATDSPRVAKVASYVPALRHIVSHGGWVIRLGDKTMRPLPKMPGVIDYALSNEKSDWMDVFLAANCRFLIATNSALFQVAMSFGVPIVATNWMPLSSFPMQAGDIVVPKLLREKHGGFLTFDEMLALPRDVWSGYYLGRKGLTVIDNAPQDILAAVDEMLVRLDQGWKSSDTALARADAFRRMALRRHMVVNAAISELFLQRHASLVGTP